jgi:hypothetical protein
MSSVRIPHFLPSANGFRFTNAWAHIPVVQVQLGSLASLSLGDAANGLCGGMSFVVADLYLSGLGQPPELSNPGGDTTAFKYIVARQFDSFAGVALPLRFYSLMRTFRPDREPPWAGFLGLLGADRHSRTYVMVHDEWPKIQQRLDAGQPAMIGLVRVVSDEPRLLGHNHQVLAYGYDLEGTDLTLHIYDPNWPNDDTVTLELDVGDPRAAAVPAYSKSDGPLVCFFSAPYARSDPTPWR